MTVTRFSAGLALLAATACTQIPAGAPVYAPPLATGATSASYDPPALQRYAPTVVAPAPVAAAPRAAAPAYQATVALPQSRMPDAMPRQLYIPAPQQARVVQAPAVQVPPAPRVPVARAPAPRVQPAPPAYVAVQSTPTAIVTAPSSESRALTIRERVAVFGAEPAQTSGSRQFRVASVEPQREGPFDPPVSIPAPSGAQVTTAEPFSIPTSPTGRPYYLGSTPPAIEYHIPHIPQEEPLWCWAAAAQQAIGWVNRGRAPSQCAIVALAHGLNVQECCNDREGICARTGEIPAIEKLVERFGGQAQELATVPRDPQVIYDILKGGDTLLIRLRPAPHDEAVGIRHMIMVRGIEWLRLPNNQLQATLLYNDPLGAGERAVNFDEIEGFFEQALVISKT